MYWHLQDDWEVGHMPGLFHFSPHFKNRKGDTTWLTL
jgi:hypothetical protein